MASQQLMKYDEPLQFDIGILHLVLKRNRNQHHRALYFRRLDMVLRAIERYSILHLSPPVGSCSTVEKKNETDASNCVDDQLGLSEIISCLKDERRRISSILDRRIAKQSKSMKRGNQHQNEDYKWTVRKPTSATAAATAKCSFDDYIQQDSSSSIIKYTKKLYVLLVKQIPEILSRIIHASSSLYIELSRGYFVPLCTVSLACISRIRILLIQLAKEGCIQYQIMVPFLRKEYLSFIEQDQTVENKCSLYYHETKAYLNFHEENKNATHIENVLKESYVELDENEYNRFMNQQLKQHVRITYGASHVVGKNVRLKSDGNINNTLASGKNGELQQPCESTSDIGDTANKICDNVESNVTASIEDIIGEQIIIDDCTAQCTSNINERQEKEDGDKNHEMLVLLKGQMKKKYNDLQNSTSAKVKKRERDVNSQDLLSCKKVKDNQKNKTVHESDTRSDSDTEQIKKRIKKDKKNIDKSKKKEKRKKKKKKKDVFDDIFDGF